MKTYWVQVSKPPFPVKGTVTTVFRQEPERDQLSPNLVCLWEVRADNAREAKDKIMVPGGAKLLI